ncbi:uncharacterized protein B0H18DRAFT_1003621 [Fomitopsis serialis]|uniref:uncharacterized protein n=1 Tax=Fomitopsis serialis TaxID=139415 RepID=UPI002008D7BE|nr:uncharacterized protein B0H18DRAFT_1003621 [Neoantrodia serialis]KAH9927235.1 hypothetical protein B0H18DRAFT_1003621 [Neoantrodia serialis]
MPGRNRRPYFYAEAGELLQNGEHRHCIAMHVRTGSSPNQAHSKAAEAGLLSVAGQPTFHADSGVRFNASGQPSGSGGGHDEHTPVDVPPSYSES